MSKSINIQRLNSSNISRMNMSESLDKFLTRIRKSENLTQEEELKIFDVIKNGTEKEVADAKNALVTSNQRFVYAVAKRYSNDDNDVMDLVQQGNIGLLIAIDSFDVTKGNRFLTYAVHYIRREITSFITSDMNIIQKTNWAKTLYNLPKVKNEFFAKEGRYPTDDEIMDIMSSDYNLKITHEDDLRDLRIESISVSYDDSNENTFENSTEFTNATASYNNYENVIEQENVKRMCKCLMNSLSEIEQKVIKMAFGIDSDYAISPEVISEYIGLTAERVRQIINTSLMKMRQSYVASR